MSPERGRRNLDWGKFLGGKNFDFVQMGQILCHFSTTQRHESNGVLSFCIWFFDFPATFGSGLCRCRIFACEQSFSTFSTPQDWWCFQILPQSCSAFSKWQHEVYDVYSMYFFIYFSLRCIMSCRSRLIHESWDLALCCYWCTFSYGFVSCMSPFYATLAGCSYLLCVFLRSLVCQDWRDTLICYMSAMVILIGVFLYVWEFCSRTSLKEVKPLLREGNFSLYVIGKHIHVHLFLQHIMQRPTPSWHRGPEM